MRMDDYNQYTAVPICYSLLLTSSLCSGMAFPWLQSLSRKSALGWSHWAVVSVGAPSPPALFLNPVVSHLLFPSPLPVQYFLPFLGPIFPEGLPVWLVGSAVSCPGGSHVVHGQTLVCPHRGRPCRGHPMQQEAEGGSTTLPVSAPADCQHLLWALWYIPG